MARSDSLPVPPSRVRVLARGRGWQASDVMCARGPRDRRFEERHGQVSLGLVLGGTFQYHSAAGRATLYPGAVLLGSPGACFECGHDHGVGDRCLALSLDVALFDELAHGVAGRAFRFDAPMLPALRQTAAARDRLQRRIAAAETAAIEEAVLDVTSGIVRALAGTPPATRAPAPRDERRIAAVARHIEEHCAEPLDLDRLAALACMSKFHFLRSFRRCLGLTPYQFVLQRRLERAARALREGEARVADLALDCGFGDLSGFTALFRSVYGCPPGRYRELA
jgi:AraC family transcriptional regulator